MTMQLQINNTCKGAWFLLTKIGMITYPQNMWKTHLCFHYSHTWFHELVAVQETNHSYSFQYNILIGIQSDSVTNCTKLNAVFLNVSHMLICTGLNKIDGLLTLFTMHTVCYIKDIVRLWLLQNWMLKTPVDWIVASNVTCSQISPICIQSMQHKKKWKK